MTGVTVGGGGGQTQANRAFPLFVHRDGRRDSRARSRFGQHRAKQNSGKHGSRLTDARPGFFDIWVLFWNVSPSPSPGRRRRGKFGILGAGIDVWVRYSSRRLSALE